MSTRDIVVAVAIGIAAGRAGDARRSGAAPPAVRRPPNTPVADSRKAM
jgi:hypothetical protein